MQQSINLSYVLTTYNKLSYLKETLPLLIEACKNDEEIVVTDGGSTDGTPKYLQELFESGKIHQFISEKDKGESDGFNKGMLLAKGEIIKIISDDDVFYFNGIADCKEKMLLDKTIDVLNSNGAALDLTNFKSITVFTEIYESFFLEKYKKNNHPFAHCALGLMIRKESLENVGFFGLGYTRADAEYTLRFTSKKIKFVWYTGINYIRINNQNSNYSVFSEKIKTDTERLNIIYQFDIDKVYDPFYKVSVVKKSSLIFRIFNKFLKFFIISKNGNKSLANNYDIQNINYHEAVILSNDWLTNESNNSKFLY